MEILKVGDKRQYKEGDQRVISITAIGIDTALFIDEAEGVEDGAKVAYILSNTIPYKGPVRKLEAWETKGNGIARGTIEFCLSDSESSIYNKEHTNEYRKLSDEELKDLIKGVIGE